MAVSSLKFLIFWCAVSACLLGAAALQCFQCGEYSDGVGSITPCLNDNSSKLIHCPDSEARFCIKYMTEGTFVRDCVSKCTEKDNWDWNSRTFCCQEDACNSANRLEKVPIVHMMLCIGIVMLHMIFHRIH